MELFILGIGCHKYNALKHAIDEEVVVCKLTVTALGLDRGCSGSFRFHFVLYDSVRICVYRKLGSQHDRVFCIIYTDVLIGINALYEHRFLAHLSTRALVITIIDRRLALDNM